MLTPKKSLREKLLDKLQEQGIKTDVVIQYRARRLNPDYTITFDVTYSDAEDGLAKTMSLDMDRREVE